MGNLENRIREFLGMDIVDPTFYTELVIDLCKEKKVYQLLENNKKFLKRMQELYTTSNGYAYDLVKADIKMLIQQELEQDDTLMHMFENIKACFDVMDACGFEKQLYEEERKELYEFFEEQIKKMESLIDDCYPLQAEEYEEYKREIGEGPCATIYKVWPTAVLKVLLYGDYVKKLGDLSKIDYYIDSVHELAYENCLSSTDFKKYQTVKEVMCYFEKISIDMVFIDTNTMRLKNFKKFLGTWRNAENYNKIGEMYYKNGKYNNALEMLGDAILLNDEDVVLYLNKVVIYAHLLKLNDMYQCIRYIVDNDLGETEGDTGFSMYEDKKDISRLFRDMAELKGDELFIESVNNYIKTHLEKRNRFGINDKMTIKEKLGYEKKFMYIKTKYDRDYKIKMGFNREYTYSRYDSWSSQEYDPWTDPDNFLYAGRD